MSGTASRCSWNGRQVSISATRWAWALDPLRPLHDSTPHASSTPPSLLQATVESDRVRILAEVDASMGAAALNVYIKVCGRAVVVVVSTS